MGPASSVLVDLVPESPKPILGSHLSIGPLFLFLILAKGNGAISQKSNCLSSIVTVISLSLKFFSPVKC